MTDSSKYTEHQKVPSSSYIKAKFEKAKKSIDQGKGIETLEVKKKLSKWLSHSMDK